MLHEISIMAKQLSQLRHQDAAIHAAAGAGRPPAARAHAKDLRQIPRFANSPDLPVHTMNYRGAADGVCADTMYEYNYHHWCGAWLDTFINS